jgi:hypothetical protein
VSQVDDSEFFRPAHSEDLATRHWLELELPPVPKGQEAGVLIRGRASLLSTFLFYQTIAYVGDQAGSWLASLERGDTHLAKQVRGIPDALGVIEVFVERNGRWSAAGQFGEAGPIAADEQVIPLPRGLEGPVRVRLKMTQGAWRLDQVGLVFLGDRVEPTVLSPTRLEPVSGEVSREAALQRLLDPDRYLVTQQGDEYRLDFQLPEGDLEWSLFLDSRGYYYEWMRDEWEGETNPAMAALILTDPAAALRMLAPAFKAQEGTMEETFWSSRFRRKHQ